MILMLLKIINCSLLFLAQNTLLIYFGEGVGVPASGLLFGTSMGVSSCILSLWRGTMALVSLASSWAQWLSTGPVCILATVPTFNFRDFTFYLSCRVFFLVAPGERFLLLGWWSLPGDLGAFCAIGVVSNGGGISRLSTCLSSKQKGDGSASSSI